MKLLKWLVATLWMGFGLSARAADCSQLTIPSVDQGWYSVDGQHASGNDNYIVGRADGTIYRNWFVFQLPTGTQVVSAAYLSLAAAEIQTTDTGETWQLRQVSTPPDLLRAGGSSLTSIYGDLGDGEVYGQVTLSSTQRYTRVRFPLNSAFLNYLNNRTNSWVVLGGELNSLSGSGVAEYVFGSSGGLGAASLEIIFGSPVVEASLLSEPQDETVDWGGEVRFQAAVCGHPTNRFQWLFNQTVLPGENSTTLYLTNLTTNQAGDYRFVVTGSFGSLTSRVARLSVRHEAPTVSIWQSNPIQGQAFEGQNVILQGTITGVPFPTLTWRRHDTNLPGFSNYQYVSFYPATTNDSGLYSLVASNLFGVSTGYYNLNIHPVPPAYLITQSSTHVAVGQFAYLYAYFARNEPRTFLQWQRDGVDLPGENNEGLFIPSMRTNDAGSYRLVVHFAYSASYTTAPVVLTTYFTPPGISTLYLSSVAMRNYNQLLSGNNGQLCALFSGSPPLTFRWRFNGQDVPGELGSCLSIFNASSNHAGSYSLIISNAAGVATNPSPFLLEVADSAPFLGATFDITTTALEGADTRLYLGSPGYAMGGPPPLHWLQKDGVNTPHPFSFDTYSGGFNLFGLTREDAGQYQFIASNRYGMVTSRVWNLIVTNAGPLDRWTQVNPLPHSRRLLSVTRGQDLFVGVGEAGAIVTSNDGTNWQQQFRRTDQPLSAVAYGDGRFVAVGAGGTILSSTNGTNWTLRHTAPLLAFGGVTHGLGRFVVVGLDAYLSSGTTTLTSTNGEDWEISSYTAANASLAVTFGQDRFVAVGAQGIITSTDGATWSLALGQPDEQLEGVCYGNGQFVAVGNDGYLLSSPDGLIWTPRQSGTVRRILDVVHGQGRFVASGVRGILLTSTNAIDWAPATSGTPDRLESITYGHDLFIVAGENGTTLSSHDGTQWARQNRGVTRDLDGMAKGDGLILVVGKGGSLLASRDGRNYAQLNPGVTNDLHGIGWRPGQWVAVGEPGVILTSPDGTNWANRSILATNSLKAVRYLRDRWLAVGTEGRIFYSLDGTNWQTSTTSPAYDLNDAAYGNGLFLIVGDGFNSINGSAFVSSNGVTWAYVNHYRFGKNLRRVLFQENGGLGSFQVAANDGLTFQTSDALGWSVNSLNYYANLRALLPLGNRWLFAGNGGTTISGPGFNWKTHATPNQENIHELLEHDGRVIAIGNRGTILLSERALAALIPPSFKPGLGANIGIEGVRGERLELQSSTNLQHWTTLQRYTNLLDPAVFLDTNVLSRPRQFYRLLPE